MLRLNPYAAAFAKKKLGQEKLNTQKPKDLPKPYTILLNEF